MALLAPMTVEIDGLGALTGLEVVRPPQFVQPPGQLGEPYHLSDLYHLCHLCRQQIGNDLSSRRLKITQNPALSVTGEKDRGI